MIPSACISSKDAALLGHYGSIQDNLEASSLFVVTTILGRYALLDCDGLSLACGVIERMTASVQLLAPFELVVYPRKAIRDATNIAC